MSDQLFLPAYRRGFLAWGYSVLMLLATLMMSIIVVGGIVTHIRDGRWPTGEAALVIIVFGLLALRLADEGLATPRAALLRRFGLFRDGLVLTPDYLTYRSWSLTGPTRYRIPVEALVELKVRRIGPSGNKRGARRNSERLVAEWDKDRNPGRIRRWVSLWDFLSRYTVYLLDVAGRPQVILNGHFEDEKGNFLTYPELIMRVERWYAGRGRLRN